MIYKTLHIKLKIEQQISTFFYNRDLIDTWAGGVLVSDGIIRLVVSVLGFDDGIFELMS
jgi:hypothetical protein